MGFLTPSRRPVPAPRRASVEDRFGHHLAYVDQPAWHPIPKPKRHGGLGGLVLVAGIGLVGGYLLHGGYEPAPQPRTATIQRTEHRPAAPQAQRAEPVWAWWNIMHDCTDENGVAKNWETGRYVGMGAATDALHLLPACSGRAAR